MLAGLFTWRRDPAAPTVIPLTLEAMPAAEPASAPTAAVAEPQPRPQPATVSPPADAVPTAAPRPEPAQVPMAAVAPPPAADEPPPAEAPAVTIPPAAVPARAAPTPEKRPVRLRSPERPRPLQPPRQVETAVNHPVETPAPVGPASPPIQAPRVVPAAASAAGAADWRGSLSAWLQSHRHYPDEARQRGDEGLAVVRITASHDGRVMAYTLVSSSGSAVLDAAAEAIFRNAQLPPLPASMTEAQITITVPIRFRLEH